MRRALSLLISAVVVLFTARASASFHITKIVQVFAGSTAAPNSSYVQLRSYAAGQNFLTGHAVTVFDQNGLLVETVNLAQVANGGDQANVLIGTAGVAGELGVAPDFTLAAALRKAGGKVCFDSIPVDCFAWGDYAGGGTGVGTPFAALTSDLAAKRKIDGGTNTSCLDAADDTDNSATDFTPVIASPKNNNKANDSCGTTTTDAGTGTDASVPGVDASTPVVDSGVGTTPTPPRDSGVTVTADAGSTGGGGGDDGGCAVSSSSSDGWSTLLGLGVAAAILVMSKRRRGGR